MLDIIKTPTIVGAAITGLIAAFGILIQWIIASTKTNFEAQTMFEKNLKEKLENIYSPLIMYLAKTIDTVYLINDDILTLINKYGYLLSSELLSSIKEIYKLESEKTENTFDSIEYRNLRLKIQKLANKEFKELQNLYNNSFNKYKADLTILGFEKVLLSIKRGFYIFTGFFWLFFIIFLLLIRIQPLEIFKNPIGNRVISLLVLVIFLTSIVALANGLGSFLDKIFQVLNKRKGLYKPGDYVLQTNYYKCKICGQSIKFYKDGEFPACNSKKTIHIIKKFIYSYIWLQDTDNS